MKKNKLSFCTFLCALAFTSISMAQTANELYESGKYMLAANQFEAMAVSEPAYFEDAGKSYTALKEWDKAIEMYTKYMNQFSGANKAEVAKIIELLKAPEEEVFIDNIGSNINSNIDEFLPRISSDGNRMFFYSTDRTNGFGGGDVWYADKTKDGAWSKPNNMGSVINTDSHEGILSLSADGNTAIVFGNYEGRFGNGDFFYSAKVGDSWTVPCNLGGGVNTDEWESMANISPDGKTLIFVAYEGRKNAEDADYETDIYITHLRNGAWTTPIPISKTINTPSSETWPFLNADGRTLYFSSDGHPGLGGADLFVTRRIGDGWDNWTTPVNLGKNINSVLDDEDLAIPASGTVAYFTRETTGEGDGFGDDDIFRMVLPLDMRPDPVVSIYGNVTNQDEELIAATLFWSDFDTGEQLGYSTSNPRTGDYLINLPFGRRYLITANQKGYLFQSEMLDLKTMVDDSIAFSEKLGSELFRMRNALSRIESGRAEYEMLLESNSSDLEEEFGKLSELSKDMNKAQADLNDAIRRSRISWLEDNSGYREVRKDISLTEANEGARIVLENIYFDTGSDNLREESIQELNRLYDIMAKSSLIIEIGGHTDNVGSDETNMDLSQARAEAVVNFVIEKGIAASRISAQGYGEDDPRATNETAEGRQENRRVEVKVLGTGNEGTGGVLEQQQDVTEVIEENLYELYRRAAIAGGIPEGAACYEKSNYTNTRETTYTNTKSNSGSRTSTKTNTDIKLSNSWFIDEDGNDISAFGGSSINFLTHSGEGAHVFPNVNGAGVLFQNGSGKGERNIYAYFMGDVIGGGVEWMRFKDISNLTKLPLSFDYGIKAFLVYNKQELTTFGGESYDFFTTAWGLPVTARLRYNMKVSDIKVSPYASYNYNLMNFVDVDPDVITEGNEQYPQGTIDSSSWLEIGARARWKFVSGGLGLQNSSAGTGIVLRAGLAF